MIESDGLFENTESLTGFLRGVVFTPGSLTLDPPRITFTPRETTIEITDDRNDGEHYLIKCRLHPLVVLSLSTLTDGEVSTMFEHFAIVITSY